MPAVKKGTNSGAAPAAPELMSDFVLDDEATAVSQPDSAPSFAVGGGGAASAAPLVEVARKLEFNVTFL